jgi:hypothetical protein
MTDLDLAAQRIHDAFERDLADYRAPSGLAKRARLGGQRRARRRRRLRRSLCAAAVACAAAAGVVAIAPRIGVAPAASGRARPGLASPAKPASGASPAAFPAAKSPAGLPSTASVSRAMLTSFTAASGDILYERFINTGGGETDESRYWSWPAQPAPGQQVRMRELWVQNYMSSARTAPTEDWATVYTYPVHPPAPNYGFTTSMVLTMVCYPPGGGCGWGPTQTPGRSWSQVKFLGQPEMTDISAGGDFNPAVLAQAIAHGQWRVVRRTRLDGQPVIELTETTAGPISPLPVELWVNAQTYLPLRCDGGGSSELFGYLPPTAANLALLQVPIPRGFPRVRSLQKISERKLPQNQFRT